MNRSPVQGEHLAPSAADSSAGQSPSLPSYRPLPPRALRLVLILAALSLTVVLSYLVAGTESGLTMTNEDVDTPQLLLEEAWPFRHLALNASQQPGKLFKGKPMVIELARRPSIRSMKLTLSATPGPQTACGQTDVT